MCSRCHGLGYYYDCSGSSPNEQGIRLCECVTDQCRCGGEFPYTFYRDMIPALCPCAPYRKKFNRVLLTFQNAGIPKKYQFKFLQDFKYDHHSTLENIYKVVYTHVQDYKPGKPGKGLFLWGNTGNGKTLLSCIILNELMFSHGIKCRYMNLSFQFYNKLRDTYSEESRDYGRTYQFLQEFIDQEVLLIDDLGVQRNTEWEQEMLYNLIDRRYQEERATFITTNQEIDTIRKLFEGRIYSRIIEMCTLIQVDAPDFRESMKLDFPRTQDKNHKNGRRK